MEGKEENKKKKKKKKKPKVGLNLPFKDFYSLRFYYSKPC